MTSRTRPARARGRQLRQLRLHDHRLPAPSSGARVRRRPQRRADRRGRRRVRRRAALPRPGHPRGRRHLRRHGAGLRRPRPADARGLPRPPGARRRVRRRWSAGRRSCCTARPAWSSTTAPGVLAGLPQPFTATRYHSLTIEPETVPDELEVTGRTASGIIMAVRHRDLPLEGVQFHPESVLTEGGHRLLANWLTTCGDDGAVERVAGHGPAGPRLTAAAPSPVRPCVGVPGGVGVVGGVVGVSRRLGDHQLDGRPLVDRLAGVALPDDRALGLGALLVLGGVDLQVGVGQRGGRLGRPAGRPRWAR